MKELERQQHDIKSQVFSIFFHRIYCVHQLTTLSSGQRFLDAQSVFCSVFCYTLNTSCRTTSFFLIHLKILYLLLIIIIYHYFVYLLFLIFLRMLVDSITLLEKRLSGAVMESAALQLKLGVIFHCVNTKKNLCILSAGIRGKMSSARNFFVRSGY